LSRSGVLGNTTNLGWVGKESALPERHLPDNPLLNIKP